MATVRIEYPCKVLIWYLGTTERDWHTWRNDTYVHGNDRKKKIKTLICDGNSCSKTMPFIFYGVAYYTMVPLNHWWQATYHIGVIDVLMKPHMVQTHTMTNDSWFHGKKSIQFIWCCCDVPICIMICVEQYKDMQQQLTINSKGKESFVRYTGVHIKRYVGYLSSTWNNNRIIICTIDSMENKRWSVRKMMDG